MPQQGSTSGNQYPKYAVVLRIEIGQDASAACCPDPGQGAADVRGARPGLVGAAGRSVFAAMLRRVERGQAVAADGEPAVDSDYRLATGSGSG